MQNTLPKDYTRLKVNLTFSKSQLDWFEAIVKEHKIDITDYILTQIQKAKENGGY